MNETLNKLERKFGRYAIKNISLYLVLFYAAAYVIIAMDMSLLNYVSLNPYAVMYGQIWRLFTWIMIPPSLSINFFTLLLLYIFYNFGTSLERTIGTFRYNIYLLSGMIFTIIGALVVMAYLFISVPELATLEHAERMLVFGNVAMSFSTFYIYMSIFLALASVIPDMTILLMFILPVKMKYIAIIYGFIMVLEFLGSNMYNRIVLVASMLNFLLFFLFVRPTKVPTKSILPKDIVKTLKRATNKTEPPKIRPAAKHQCTACGITGIEAPDREFRFCSKCEGNYEYCDEHLFTHTHVVKTDE
ncbi:MAG: rhomboid family intramembrane serine protease [Lachnospiraceae bacterium]|nr:rhomboid family intramembrane serine protease [Lachnospiraceae bacterium]